MSLSIIKARLAHDQEFLSMCILKLYELQEDDEQASQSTTADNGVGFNKSDAPFLSDMAEAIKSEEEIEPDKWFMAGGAMIKYAGQLSHLLTLKEIEE